MRHAMTSDPSPLPPFEAPYAPDDGAMAARLLETAGFGAAQEQRDRPHRDAPDRGHSRQ